MTSRHSFRPELAIALAASVALAAMYIVHALFNIGGMLPLWVIQWLRG